VNRSEHTPVFFLLNLQGYHHTIQRQSTFLYNKYYIAMKTNLLIISFLFSFGFISAQEWEQLAGEPEGGGVTDIYVNEDNGNLFVATGSLNWPNGEDGGIRRSTDDGATWDNVFDAYTSRFIMEGPDGYLYASIWPYPQDEGLYRSTDNGNTWDLLVTVPTGNNIFACTILEGNPNIIYAGTGAGVYRSLDNGNTWSYANTGLPSGVTVRSMGISPDGSTIAAGTTSGLYVSANNGDNWDMVTGDVENEIVTSIAFDVVESDKKIDETRMFIGSEPGRLFLATSATLFLTAYFCVTLALNHGITRIMTYNLINANSPIFLASLYSATGGLFMIALAGYLIWQSYMLGLPAYPIISMFTSYLLAGTLATIIIYIAMYGNNPNGAKVYKATKDVATGIEGSPYNDGLGMALYQNFPNPFKDKTLINFRLSENGNTSLKLFDMAGNLIKTLKNENLQAGAHSVNLTNEGIPAGMYYYELRSNKVAETKKLIVQ